MGNMQCNLLLVLELMSKFWASTCKWQGQGGNTTLTN